MSITYRVYNKKLKTKYEVGLEFIKITSNSVGYKGMDVEKGEFKIGSYEKGEAKKITDVIEKVLNLTQVRSNIL